VPGLILSAPASGAGKTTITLGILRALARRGIAVRGAKSGPDYIDPRFHEAACGQPCLNLDAWAMTPERIAALVAGPGLVVIEGAMGLFDGAPPDGRGATADLARILKLPVILIADVARMAGSVAPLIAGFARHDPLVRVAGVILNRTGSPRHEAMLRRAIAPMGPPVLGAVPRSADLSHPSRHLGLVQAGERADLDAFIDGAADLVSARIDLDALAALATPLPDAIAARPMPPPAQRIAIAQDAAFAFSYPHILADWHRAGAEITVFSPLADEAAPAADLIYLPGGYPELHAGRISCASNFMQSIRFASQATDIYGECGGYMVMGDGLTDADGHRHKMLGLLRLETTFAKRSLHLGYRNVSTTHGPFAGHWAAHEFHYATTIRAEGPTLFSASDAEGTELPPMGLRAGRACGSFAHLIDRR
jgi:cobyrinic acid a,c-diamide synthase